ncbi:MAG: hypothetical protein OEZ43_11640 [Gammaproteobacteria bacterium]|nr:hypothetical protein [Gammaproteobacteria bacterium]
MKLVVKTLLAAMAALMLTSASVVFANEDQAAAQEACAAEAESMSFESAEDRQDFMADCMSANGGVANTEEAGSNEATAAN